MITDSNEAMYHTSYYYDEKGQRVDIGTIHLSEHERSAQKIAKKRAKITNEISRIMPEELPLNDITKACCD